jgi:hypothetical protein
MKDTEKVLEPQVNGLTCMEAVIAFGATLGGFTGFAFWIVFKDAPPIQNDLVLTVAIFLLVAVILGFGWLGEQLNRRAYQKSLRQLFETITTNLDNIVEGVVPTHGDKTLPEHIKHLVRAANDWHHQTQQLKDEKAELADAAVVAADRAQRLEVEKEELADAADAAAADLAEMARIIWANHGASREPQQFTMAPKTACEKRRLVGARAFHLLGLIRPELTYSQFLEMFPSWELPLITDIMAEAIAHHLIDDNWPLCRDVRHKIGNDAFDDKIKHARSRSEAEKRRRSNQPDET